MSSQESNAVQNGRLVQINRSEGGVPKLPVSEVAVGTMGLESDVQRDKKHHGGPNKAVCLWSRELIEALREEGHPVESGSTGENLTIEGIVWSSLKPGARLSFEGGVVLEITEYAVPCKTIAGSFAKGAFVRIGQKVNPGWSRLYAKVLSPGVLSTGQSVRAEISPEPEA